MEINDKEYIDELLRGMESKVGATIPSCLSKPILAGWSLSNTLGQNELEASTPIKSTGLRSENDVLNSGDKSPSKRDDTEASVSAFQNVSPVKRLTDKRQQLDDNCRKLRSDMNELRAMDVSLMKHFLIIYDAVEELRWMMESYDISDSCESLSSSVYESIEQIHEKWMTERRQWQSTSSRDLSTTSWKDDSRFNIHHVGRLNSTGSRRQDGRYPKYHGLSLQNTSWQSPQKDINRSLPQFSSGSNFERQRRSSVDHLPIITKAPESPDSSPRETRTRRSSSGVLELDIGVVEVNTESGDQEKAATADSKNTQVKKKFLFHSQSSPAFDSQLQWVEVTDTAII